ncbi:Trifunctional purine biosynthetic protein adenosine-3 [Nymphon striatum]|nr:Trifunctional purine biosynthetic protein adenosine-3 [Nymphon striatum]
MSKKVLLIGGGGREHAITIKLSQSPIVQQIFVTPGNAGTDSMQNVHNLDIKVEDHAKVAEWCKENSINLVVVGPEAPLANGIQNHLEAEGIACYGPSKEAALIESSKEYAKIVMEKYNIPTARWEAFDEPDSACAHICSATYKAHVIKVDGLAAGKGVVVAQNAEEAKQTIRYLFEKMPFGQAGKRIIVEELLEGQEVSVLSFTDGKFVHVMPPSQDYKRLNDGDTGPNTGGMGAYCPCSWLSQNSLDIIKDKIIIPTINGLLKEGHPFKGILYTGLMITPDGPKVLEYNCRFGDPETQVILPLLQSDLYEIMECSVQEKLDTIDIKWNQNKSVVTVILVSGGYPGAYKKHLEITGIDQALALENVQVIHAGTTKNKDGKILTNGGRVLAVTSESSSLRQSARNALAAAKAIHFDGKYFRSDISQSSFTVMNESNGLTYADCGVNIGIGNTLISKIKPVTDSTKCPGVIGSIGGFGGLFDLKLAGFTDENIILVSGTDGVGTKLMIAQECGLHDTIGIDLVAMCVNDVLAQGAQPIFFLDYFACGKIDLAVTESVITGIAKGCTQAGCALIGGETAEMPGMYSEKKYDLAGFCVGAVRKDDLLPKLDEINEGDVIIGLSSSGMHSNGFSMIRRILEKNSLSYNDQSEFCPGKSIGEALLIPTKIYSHLLALIQKCKAFVHITGGGLIENIPRVLKPNLGVVLDASSWEVPPVFSWIVSLENISSNEMLKTFNCGIGAILIIDKNAHVNELLSELKVAGETAWKIGNVQKISDGQEPVEVKNMSLKLNSKVFSQSKRNIKRKKVVGVLISGSGTNLQALIDAAKKSDSSYKISMVISNVDGIKGLERAQNAGIKTKVINHKKFKSREIFDDAVNDVLIEENIEFVCLAGFMRILSAKFVKKWRGRLLNVHPSLLPSFRGMHAQRQALEAGVSITGCTVHFVSEELDAGAIITQEAVPVLNDDNENILQERIKKSEYIAYPRALQMLTSESIVLNENGKIEKVI